MSKTEFIGINFFICLANFVLQVWFVASAADVVAKAIGDQLSFFFAPVVIAQLFPFIFLCATSSQLTSSQKIGLFVIPAIFTFCVICIFYLVVQYGGPL